MISLATLEEYNKLNSDKKILDFEYPLDISKNLLYISFMLLPNNLKYKNKIINKSIYLC